MGKLVYAKSELHALDGTTDVLVNFAVALLFGGSLLDYFCGVVSFEIWS